MACDPEDAEGAPFGEPDREADTDNGHLYGYTDPDDPKGRTQWYDSQGNCDAETSDW